MGTACYAAMPLFIGGMLGSHMDKRAEIRPELMVSCCMRSALVCIQLVAGRMVPLSADVSACQAAQHLQNALSPAQKLRMLMTMLWTSASTR